MNTLFLFCHCPPFMQSRFEDRKGPTGAENQRTQGQRRALLPVIRRGRFFPSFLRLRSSLFSSGSVPRATRRPALRGSSRGIDRGSTEGRGIATNERATLQRRIAERRT